MTWVKICGTTNLDDALLAVDAGADAVGFVFYEKSPRNISPEAAAAIIAQLPENIEKIGVFVIGTSTEPGPIVRSARLTGMQCCLVLSPTSSGSKATGLAALGPHCKRGLVSLPAESLLSNGDQVERHRAIFAEWREAQANSGAPEGIFDTFLLDSSSIRQPGGTGKTFDWRGAVPVAKGMQQVGLKLVVAGGLTPENVGEAMSVLAPWGVDVVSGVEARPGKKDPEKVRAFMKAVRDKDRKAN